MKKWKATWYDQNSIIQVDAEPIIAVDEESARRAAFTRHNGNPPAQFLMLEEIL